MFRVEVIADNQGREETMNERTERIRVSIEDVLSAVEADDCRGFCTKCGEEAYGVEPDARKYVCETCGLPAVYGAEELMFYMHA